MITQQLCDLTDWYQSSDGDIVWRYCVGSNAVNILASAGAELSTFQRLTQFVCMMTLRS